MHVRQLVTCRPYYHILRPVGSRVLTLCPGATAATSSPREPISIALCRTPSRDLVAVHRSVENENTSCAGEPSWRFVPCRDRYTFYAFSTLRSSRQHWISAESIAFPAWSAMRQTAKSVWVREDHRLSHREESTRCADLIARARKIESIVEIVALKIRSIEIANALARQTYARCTFRVTSHFSTAIPLQWFPAVSPPEADTRGWFRQVVSEVNTRRVNILLSRQHFGSDFRLPKESLYNRINLTLRWYKFWLINVWLCLISCGNVIININILFIYIIIVYIYILNTHRNCFLNQFNDKVVFTISYLHVYQSIN